MCDELPSVRFRARNGTCVRELNLCYFGAIRLCVCPILSSFAEAASFLQLSNVTLAVIHGECSRINPPRNGNDSYRQTERIRFEMLNLDCRCNR